MAVDERDTSHRDDSSRASSRDVDSIKSFSETDSLLSPATAASTPNYKSTATFSDVESAQNSSQVDDATTGKVTKSVAIVISLLLIGSFHKFFIQFLCTYVSRCFHIKCRWHPSYCNIWYHRFRIPGTR